MLLLIFLVISVQSGKIDISRRGAILRSVGAGAGAKVKTAKERDPPVQIRPDPVVCFSDSELRALREIVGGELANDQSQRVNTFRSDWSKLGTRLSYSLQQREIFNEIGVSAVKRAISLEIHAAVAAGAPGETVQPEQGQTDNSPDYTWTIVGFIISALSIAANCLAVFKFVKYKKSALALARLENAMIGMQQMGSVADPKSDAGPLAESTVYLSLD